MTVAVLSALRRSSGTTTRSLRQRSPRRITSASSNVHVPATVLLGGRARPCTTVPSQSHAVARTGSLAVGRVARAVTKPSSAGTPSNTARTTSSSAACPTLLAPIHDSTKVGPTSSASGPVWGSAVMSVAVAALVLSASRRA